MYTKDNKNGEDKRSFFDKVLSVQGIAIIAVVLILLYAIIYYIDMNQSGIIKNFVRIARYELIFLIYIGVVVVIVIRFAQIVADIFRNKAHGGNYTVSAILLPIYFMLVIENFSYSMNDVMDMFSSGQPFAIIILFLVLGSVLMICVLSIEIIFSRKSDYTIKKAHEVAGSVTDVATELIGSFVRLVKFVTVDYLVEVKNMVCDDTGTKNYDSEREGENHGSGDQAGAANRTGTGRNFGESNKSNESAGDKGARAKKND